MNSILSKALIFAGGAAVGAVISWKLLKTHFERISQEEIDSVKEYYSNRQNATDDTEKNVDDDSEDTTEEEPTEPDNRTVKDYAAILSKQQYTKYASEPLEDKSENYSPDEGPYVISPTEFGSHDNYDTISLTYYSDGVLADDMDEPVTDVNDTVGLESLECIGDYEEDCVFVRNDALKTDFEILADSRRYCDVTGRSATEV